MSRARRIVRWISISVIIQVALLAYGNFVYLPNRGKVTVSAFNFAEEKITQKNVKLPEGAAGVTVSYNGLFAAYRIGDSIEIMDVKDRKPLKRIEVQKGVLTYFTWLRDRDILIYSVKEPGGKKGQLQLCTYDLGTSSDRNYPKLTGLPAGSEVIDIEVSALTNIVYFKVKTGDKSARIYKYNIMDKLKNVMSAKVETEIRETFYTDNLVYCDSKDDIYILDGKNSKKKKLDFEAKLSLLFIDNEDNIYAGVLNETGEVTAIYTGKTELKENEWKTVELEMPVNKNDIYITDSGRIYMADRQNGTLKVVEDGKTFRFNGELLQVLEDYMVTVEGNKLQLTPIIDA